MVMFCSKTLCRVICLELNSVQDGFFVGDVATGDLFLADLSTGWFLCS